MTDVEHAEYVDSAERRRELIRQLGRARTWSELFAVSNTINDAGMEEPDRLAAWEHQARNVTRLRGSSWSSVQPTTNRAPRKFSGGIGELW